jgi:hypothetical protein
MNASLFGLMAEFASPERLLEATRRTHAAGYRKIEAYSPFSIEGLAEAAGMQGNRMPLITLLGGLAGSIGGYLLQWYSAVIDYPIDSGGRPLHAWPAFIPPTFELAVLGAALAAFFGCIVANGLPKLYHPVFNAKDFDLASRNRFFLCICATDPQFDRDRTGSFLHSLQPQRLSEVER